MATKLNTKVTMAIKLNTMVTMAIKLNTTVTMATSTETTINTSEHMCRVEPYHLKYTTQLPSTL